MTDSDHALVCSGKVHYCTWEAANAARKRHRRNWDHKPGRYLRVYRCPCCGGFCVGTGFREKRRKTGAGY